MDLLNYKEDKRVVLTLDAGGTNFVFSAIQGYREIVNSVTLPSYGYDLKLCLATIIKGFREIKSQLSVKPVAISFAFPGEAHYPEGIIGDLLNLPAFRGGVALGPMLENEFEIPVFINNDGDLFTFGEAINGLLPAINAQLEKAGSLKRYNNLLGITLGTGFGGGLAINNTMFLGDNSAGMEIWSLRNKKYPDTFVEESASITAIKRVYQLKTKIKAETDLEPKDIYEIACGNKHGDKQAAIDSFNELGEIVGDTLANAIGLIDGLVVIGGGITGAHRFFLPKIVEEMNSKLKSIEGKEFSRLEVKVFNLEQDQSLNVFLKGQIKEITVPGTNRKISYDPLKRIGVGISRLGTNEAVFTGAYAFALKSFDKQSM